MSVAGWLQLVALVAGVAVVTRLLGPYLARVLGGRLRLPATASSCRSSDSSTDVAGIEPSREQPWTIYAFSLLAFSGISVLGLFILQRVQGVLFLNPTDVAGVPPALAFNTAASFVTNTNWQNYGGESTMAHLTQMSGLAVQNFVSAAVGIAVAVALVRGLTRRPLRHDRQLLGRPHRTTTRVLVPLRCVVAIVLVSQGVVQNLNGFTEATTVEGAPQSIPGGPIASQEAIKELGTNGGGPYNANSAHPFENPNGFSNFVEMLAILAIPFGLTYAFGRLVGDQRQGWAVFAAMFVLWIASAGIAMGFEIDGNPRGRGARDDGRRQLRGQGGPLRHRASGLFAATTTGTSTGAVNAAHDSFTPLGGAVPLVNMMLGEVSPGGVGAGLYGMLIFALLAVFIAGPHGRTDARVPRQEDPGDGDEARRPLHPDRSDARSSPSPRSRFSSTTPRRRS